MRAVTQLAHTRHRQVTRKRVTLPPPLGGRGLGMGRTRASPASPGPVGDGTRGGHPARRVRRRNSSSALVRSVTTSSTSRSSRSSRSGTSRSTFRATTGSSSRARTARRELRRRMVGAPSPGSRDRAGDRRRIRRRRPRGRRVRRRRVSLPSFPRGRAGCCSPPPRERVDFFPKRPGLRSSLSIATRPLSPPPVRADLVVRRIAFGRPRACGGLCGAAVVSIGPETTAAARAEGAARRRGGRDARSRRPGRCGGAGRLVDSGAAC